jgi:hypothetical protein
LRFFGVFLWHGQRKVAKPPGRNAVVMDESAQHATLAEFGTANPPLALPFSRFVKELRLWHHEKIT